MTVKALSNNAVIFEYKISYEIDIQSFIEIRCKHLLLTHSLEEIIQSRFKINNRIVEKNYVLKKDDLIEFLHLKSDENIEINAFTIIYEDENILVLDKNSNISVNPHFPFYFNCLNILLRDFLKYDIYPLHRIDYATSGLILFAKNKKLIPTYHKLFTQEKINKFYLSYHQDSPSHIPKRILGKIIKDESSSIFSKQKFIRNQSMTIAEIINFEAVDKFFEIESQLINGKTNALRAMFSAFSCSIIGDIKYGFDENAYLEWLKTREKQHLCLHAYRLKFMDPISKKVIDIQSDNVDYIQKKNFHKKIQSNDKQIPTF